MTSSSEAITETGTKSAKLKEEYKRFIGRKILFVLSSFIVMFIIAGVAVTLGSADITIFEAYTTILHRFFPNYFHTDWLTDVCVWHLRLPRVVLAILAGVGLGIAGAMMQGILKNPLASPFTLGISSGAAFGAALALILGAGLIGGKYLLIGNAFLFSLVPTFVILGLARYRGATPETMILAGIALVYIFSAATTLIEYFASGDAVKAVVFWTVGSLGKASWETLLPIFITLTCFIPLLMWKSWDINVMGAGDEVAKSLGVNVERTRIFIMVIASLLAASIVCFTGTIGFIGLVAPHMCRIVIGGDNRFLIPASGLLGGTLLLSADTVARTIIAPIILPVGVLTAFMGGPLFLYLIMRRRKGYW